MSDRSQMSNEVVIHKKWRFHDVLLQVTYLCFAWEECHAQLTTLLQSASTTIKNVSGPNIYTNKYDYVLYSQYKRNITSLTDQIFTATDGKLKIYILLIKIHTIFTAQMSHVKKNYVIAGYLNLKSSIINLMSFVYVYQRSIQSKFGAYLGLLRKNPFNKTHLIKFLLIKQAPKQNSF